MSRKVLITGIGGLLGSELAKKYHENGCEVFGIQRSSPKSNQVAYTIFTGDINDEIFLEESIKGMDLVIHSAAKVSFDRRDKIELYHTNVIGTQKVVNTCLALSTPKFIHVSSVAALGRNADNMVINEENQWENSKLNTNYGYSKYLAEQEFWRGIEEGLNGFCVNPSIILGRGDTEASSNKLFENVNKKIIFYVDGSINVVDLRDVVDQIWYLDQKNVNAERYISNGHSVKFKDFMLKIAKDQNVYLIKANKFLVCVTWLADGLSSWILRKRSKITLETLKVMKAESRYDKTKLVKELNYTYRTLDDTMDHCKTHYCAK